MGPIEAVMNVMLKYFTLRGRAPRSEYWWFMLACIIAVVAAGVADGHRLVQVSNSETPDLGALAGMWTPWVLVLTFVPYHTVAVRRLHDVGLSGWWMPGLLYLPPIFMVTLMFAARDRIAAGELDLMVVSNTVLGLCNLAFWVLMLWPGQRFENRFGPGLGYQHHRAGGGNDLAVATAATGGAARSTGGTSAEHNAWSGYLALERAEYAHLPEVQEARKAQVQSLYRQKILGLKDEDAGQTG